MKEAPKERSPDPGERDPEEEGSAAREPQTPSPPGNDPEEEGSAARPQR